MEYDQKINDEWRRSLAEGRIKYHHRAWRRGYVSRKSNALTTVERYEGKFGRGYIVHTPSWSSTLYHHVEYYIEIKEDEEND